MGTEPDAAGAALRVARLLRALTTAVGIYADRARADVGLHRSDLNALGLLSQAHGEGRQLSAGELGRRLHLSPSATTALLDRLHAVGHVNRARHPDDRRRVVLDLTESAQSTGRQAFGPLQQAVERSLAPFEPGQLQQAAEVMEALLHGIEDAAETLGEGGRAGL